MFPNEIAMFKKKNSVLNRIEQKMIGVYPDVKKSNIVHLVFGNQNFERLHRRLEARS